MRITILALVFSGMFAAILSAYLLVLYNPSKLPFEAIGLKDYEVLLADESEPDEEDLSGTLYEGRKSVFLTVSTRRSGEQELREIARDIRDSGRYDGYDFLEVGFTYRYADDWPTKGFAVVALTQEGERAGEEWPKEPASGSKNSDQVYFF